MISASSALGRGVVKRHENSIKNIMMQSLINRLSIIFITEPENAAKACALLLVLYVTTLVPLLAWAFFSIPNPAKRKEVPLEKVSQPINHNGRVQLPTPEQTALLISKRRSIFTKDLSGETVDRSVVEKCLEAANWAPTHGKTEPWRFVVFGRDHLDTFIDAMVKAVGASSLKDKDAKIAKLNSKRSKLGSVAYAIAICFKRQAGEKLMPEWEELAATSAAVQNLHLMATAEGAAGYWTSWGPEEARDSSEVKEFLGLKPEDRCIGVFLMGAADGERISTYKAKRGPIAEKVEWRV